ncbi:MAG: hypothetical protein ACI4WG_00330 [Erysipelotrichaceae bacterium]
MKKLLIGLLSLLMVISLVGCGNSKPQKVVQSFLDGYRQANANIMQETVLGEDNYIVTVFQCDDSFEKSLVSFAAAQITYKIIETTYSDDKQTAYVAVEITTKDYATALLMATQSCTYWAYGQILSGVEVSEEEIYDKIIDELQDYVSEASETITFNVTFVLEKDVDGKWKINFDKCNEELINSLLANMMYAFE